MLNLSIQYMNHKKILINGVKNENVRAFLYLVYSE